MDGISASGNASGAFATTAAAPPAWQTDQPQRGPITAVEQGLRTAPSGAAVTPTIASSDLGAIEGGSAKSGGVGDPYAAGGEFSRPVIAEHYDSTGLVVGSSAEALRDARAVATPERRDVATQDSVSSALSPRGVDTYA